jgi:hypothetical protein
MIALSKNCKYIEIFEGKGDNLREEEVSTWICRSEQFEVKRGSNFIDFYLILSVFLKFLENLRTIF